MIKLLHKNKISTFIVSNGTLPNIIKNMELPTQFYISMQAPNKELYIKITRPKLADSWDKFTESLKIMKHMKTRTVLRMSLIKNLNMTDIEGYAKLIKIAKPWYVEVKGFSFVGGAREPARNLKYSDMPLHDEIKSFAAAIAEKTGYLISNEHKTSRMVLLSKDKDTEQKSKINFNALFK